MSDSMKKAYWWALIGLAVRYPFYKARNASRYVYNKITKKKDKEEEKKVEDF